MNLSFESLRRLVVVMLEPEAEMNLKARSKYLLESNSHFEMRYPENEAESPGKPSYKRSCRFERAGALARRCVID